MELTKEQNEILETLNNDEKVVKIDAFAGAAKTTTLVELVKKIRETNKTSKILYIVFNKAMVEDAKKKFDSLGLNVDCYTTHSFALRRFTALKDGNVKVMPNIDYSDYLKIKGANFKYKYAKYKNILDMFTEYCLTFDNLETFCDNIKEKKDLKKYNLDKNNIKSYEVDFFEELYQYFLDNGKYLHNMYLKEYSCNCNDLIRGYDYFCADELQDLNPLMLNIIKRIRYKKMWGVGDRNQQIYAWNGAINALAKIEGRTLPLSTSFRFNDEICKVANDILALKKNSNFKHGDIKNFHNNTDIENINKKTILFRKNSTMFEYAVELVKNADNIKVHFMDIVNGQKGECFDETFSEMLYFYNKLLEAKNPYSETLQIYRSRFNIKRSKNIDGYVNIAKKENSDLYKYLCYNKSVLSLDLAKFFNFFLINEKEIVDVLEKVRGSEDNTNPNKEYYLCTAHASKGREWSWVKIANDDWRLTPDDEINLLYVACTRARNKLDYSSVYDLIYNS